MKHTDRKYIKCSYFVGMVQASSTVT